MLRVSLTLFLNTELYLLKTQTRPQAAETPLLSLPVVSHREKGVFFVSGYFKSLLCENFKQFGHTVAHAAPSGLFLFFSFF